MAAKTLWAAAVVFASLPQQRHPEVMSVMYSARSGHAHGHSQDVPFVEFVFACPFFMHFQYVREEIATSDHRHPGPCAQNTSQT